MVSCNLLVHMPDYAPNDDVKAYLEKMYKRKQYAPRHKEEAFTVKTEWVQPKFCRENSILTTGISRRRLFLILNLNIYHAM